MDHQKISELKALRLSVNFGNLWHMIKPKIRINVADLIDILGISRKTLYNWEQAGKIPAPKRDPMSGYRYYDEKDIEHLKKMTGRE